LSARGVRLLSWLASPRVLSSERPAPVEQSPHGPTGLVERSVYTVARSAAPRPSSAAHDDDRQHYAFTQQYRRPRVGRARKLRVDLPEGFLGGC